MIDSSIQFILASQSPRRAELLRDAGIAFDVVSPPESVEESANKDLSPERLVIELAMRKAEYVVGIVRSKSGQAVAEPIAADTFVQQNATSIIVLAADTIAHCRGEILGKPTSRSDAERMLQLMSGQLHEVLTGVCLWNTQTNHHLEFLEITSLRMDDLNDSQLQQYLDTDDWRGKAGAFGYQDGLDWVYIEAGLASNVVGLPVERLEKWIGELN